MAQDPPATQEQWTLGSVPLSEIVSVEEENDLAEFGVPDAEGIQAGSTVVVAGAEAAG